MRKLFNFKEWLTLEEAANYLSIVFEEKVSVSDVLRLALDRHLKLSVNFVNHAFARKGKRVTYEEAEKISMPSLNGDGTNVTIVCGLKFVNSITRNVEEVVQFDKKVIIIEGVWDLTMIGGERLDVEHKFQQLTDGPSVELVNMDGCYIEDFSNGLIYELQESFDNNPFSKGSMAHLEKIRNQIFLNKTPEVEAEILIQKHKEDRKIFLENAKKDEFSNYYPIGGLPQDSVLVVRAKAISEFIQLASKEEKANKPIVNKERESMLKIIHALAKNGYKYPNHGAIAEIVRDFETNNNGVTENTLTKYLKEADSQ